ncbi:MAG: hypothetical protein LBS96_05800 [Oscillospiraceae bacterium]|jgi:hypothetical protein|nr:hypothetical protein [Oscillospiraceae bacterium]
MELKPIPHPAACAHCGKPLRQNAGGANIGSIGAPPAPARAEPPAAPAHVRTHFAAYAQGYVLELPAEKDAVIPLPLRRQRAEGGFRSAGGETDGGAVIPAEGYYILLWETGVEQADGAATLELRINNSGAALAERLAPGYYSGQQHSWFNKDDRVALALRNAEPASAAVTGATAQLTLIRLG